MGSMNSGCIVRQGVSMSQLRLDGSSYLLKCKCSRLLNARISGPIDVTPLKSASQERHAILSRCHLSVVFEIVTLGLKIHNDLRIQRAFKFVKARIEGGIEPSI